MSSAESEDGFDFIIVGSGAGGAPLAARLAREDKRVLVIEAGSDHGKEGAFEPANEVSRVPILSGVSTEHEALSWRFFVDHYERGASGQLPGGIAEDPKWHKSSDEQQDGIFYPRASSVGGCTIHNAMITIAGPDSDWDDLADELQDDSWRADCMRAYFQLLEHNDYMPRPASEQRNALAIRLKYVWDSFRWLFGYRPDSTAGRHGFDGWLHTSVADISLGLGDKQLVRMLKAALLQAKRDGLENAWSLVRRFIKGEIHSALDPNHQRTQRESPEGVVMIPTSIHGAGTTIHQNRQAPYAMLGRRSSPRELLYEAQATCGGRLTIWTDCLVTEILMKEAAENSDEPPRAVGVRFLRGKKLYRAHVSPNQPPDIKHDVYVKRGGEVILCGGSFNTPQLLMLSGIGDKVQLNKFGITCRVHSPGVGRNLQDRYEVSLVGQMKRNFAVLDGATIRLPKDQNDPDPLLRQWREDGTGLYASNGAVLAIMKRSRPELAQPDLFIFGLPIEFRGYEVGYSTVRHFDRFTWVILKSHTSNRDGQVTLRSADPLDTPKINFNSFNTASRPGKSESDPDVLAIAEGVKFVKKIFKCAGPSLVTEIHPAIPDHNSDAINRWIRSQAWGHHACGTCRMGRDGDPYAVLDSQFRVRGVQGLRVVDASIFPKIPGYFIVTNMYMASEKAAQVIIDGSAARGGATSRAYPEALFELECAAIKRRRIVLGSSASASEAVPASSGSGWNNTVTGLALSGGGIRSATFSLGILQSMAQHSMLRRIDFLSTVSGGGYIGSCIGRLYDRLHQSASTSAASGTERAAKLVERELTDVDSPLIDWLRKHGNYIAPQGRGDGRLNVAIFVRNILSVHLVVGLLIFTVFGIANIIRYELFDKLLATSFFGVDRTDFPVGHLISSTLGPFFSPWFILVELLLLFLVLPRIIGYWIVSQDQHEAFKRAPLIMLFLVAGLLLFIGVQGAIHFEPLVIGVGMLSSLLQVELAWRRGRLREEALGTGGVETQRLRTRNFLTYDLGLGLALAGMALVFALVDTAGHALQELKIAGNPVYARTFATLGAGIAAAFPIARWLANKLAGENAKTASTFVRIVKRDVAAGALAALLFTLPLVLYAFAAHAAFDGGALPLRGIGITVLTAVLTIVLAFPSALTFVNRSSLAQTYSARLARAYFGASNPLRRRAEGQNVTEVISGDDVASIRDYQPHEASGPLHIINLTVNQTVDSGSRTRKRDRQGDNMAVSCLGISVGEYWHSKWSGPRSEDGKRKVPARLETLGLKPGEKHPLVDQLNRPASRVEMLSLRQWIGISGAAVDPGSGRNTNVGMALLMGMVNLRTGYWWDTGIPESAHDGFPDLSPMRRFLYLVPRYLTTQFLLLYEWTARFPGPWERFWHLSDGGYFENTGGYELVRRQLPRIILCDGSADPTCQLESFADFVRKVRIDFGATIETFTVAEINHYVPETVRSHVGTVDQLKLKKSPDGEWLQRPERTAALFWITYASRPDYRSVLLYIKANLVGDEPVDVQQYSRTAPDFPHEDTADQFFDEAQWESYRKLGEHISQPLFRDDWFWKI